MDEGVLQYLNSIVVNKVIVQRVEVSKPDRQSNKDQSQNILCPLAAGFSNFHCGQCVSLHPLRASS